MNKEELNNKIGKKWFLSNENSINAILDYKSGILDFDNELSKNKIKDYKIHIVEYPKGILIKLAKHFSSVKFGINKKEIISTNLSILNSDISIFTINTIDNEVVFHFDNQHTPEVQDFLKISKIKTVENISYNSERSYQKSVAPFGFGFFLYLIAFGLFCYITYLWITDDSFRDSFKGWLFITAVSFIGSGILYLSKK